MALKIESPEILHLIEQISKITGESAETVVAVAVRERLHVFDEAEAVARRRAEVYALVKKLQARFQEVGIPFIDHGELLYGEDGLPRRGELSVEEIRFYFPKRYTLPACTDRGEAWLSKSKRPKPSA